MSRRSRSQWLDLLLGTDFKSRLPRPKRASSILRKLEILEDRLAPSVSFQQVLPPPNQNYYPFTSSNPNTSIAFNESSMVEASAFNNTNATFDVFYNDEHAMALGVRQVNVISKGVTTTTNYAFSTMTSDPGAVTNPSVGATATTGDQAGIDTFGRPMYPSLFITDITNNPNDHSGDWQYGGTAIAPSAVFGAWKGFVRTVDNDTNKPTVTVTGDADPAKNDWNLGAGADTPPAGLADLGYGTEIRWDLNQLYQQGLIQAGHTYRFYVIIHDGDQTRGGDSGQAAVDVTVIQNPGIAGIVFLDSNGNAIQDNGELGIAGVTVYLTNSSSTTIGTATTDATGSYSFNGLTAGTYTVQFVAPSGYNFSTASTDTVTLTGGQTQNINAGLFQPNSVTGDVWTDSNANAVQDAGEGGLASVTVNLVSGGATVSTTVTDANGAFSFSGLSPVDYTVQFTAPANYEFSTPASEAFTLVSGQPEQVNAGVFQDGAVSGVAWLDSNANAVLDAGENGLAGVTVYLLDNTNTTVGSATTDSSGNYSITGVPPGSYTAQFVAPNGYVLSMPAADDVTLTSGQADNNVDVGLFQPAAVSGEVWSDTNANGVIDAGEVGKPGVTVDLLSGTTTLSSTTTDANGNYSISGLNPGNYMVQIIAPPGDPFSTPSIDSFTLTSGQTDTFNAGVYQDATISGNAWLDSNANGLKNAGESNLTGVTVYLLNSSSATIGTATTDASGNYSFANLTPGSYEVNFAAPAGDQFSTPATDAFTLTSGQVASANAGFFQPNSLAGKVYLDANVNGTLDSGEAGVAGLTVVLSGTDTSGNSITPQTVTTDANGNYQLSIEPSGNFTLTETAPPGDFAGKDQVGSAGGTAGTNQISNISLVGGTNATSYNFAAIQPNTISGTVFSDVNDNGRQDAGEPAIPGVTMTLTGTNDLGNSVSLTTTTDASGNYSFSDLRPGSYQLTQTLPAIWLEGKNTPGTTGVTYSNETMQGFQLTSGQTAGGNLFADLQGAQVTGVVYDDINHNGKQDPGEPGLSGVTMTLAGTDDQGNSVSLTVTTTADGTFAFTHLRPGQYTLQETQPPQFQPGTNAVGTQGGTETTPGTFANFTLSPGQTGSANNFAQWQPSSLAGNVYLDSNNNGRQDPGEPNLGSVTVTLTGVSNGTPVTQTTTTAADGTFTFSNLTPGTYAVTETVPVGLFTGINQLGTGGGTLSGNTMSNIVVGPNNQLLNYTFAVSPFNPLDPRWTKRYFLSANQSNTGPGVLAGGNVVAAPAADPSSPPAANFQAALVPSPNADAAPASNAPADPPATAMVDATITPPPQTTIVAATTPFSNFDLLRILAADASITDPASNGASSHSSFRASALTATGGT
jgi:uncharacterized surface anchored protein